MIIHYINWLNFPYCQNFNTVISWRNPGLYLLMNIKINAVKIIQDFHDNFAYTLNELNEYRRPELLNYFNSIISNYIFWVQSFQLFPILCQLFQLYFYVNYFQLFQNMK